MGVVELVEESCQSGDVAGDTGGIVALCGGNDFACVCGEMLYKLDFLCFLEKEKLLLGAVALHNAVRLKVSENTADTCVCILNVVYGILVVLGNRKVKVKVHLGV